MHVARFQYPKIQIDDVIIIPSIIFIVQKNDAEKDLLRMSHAHKSQNELVQKLQDKAHKVCA